MKRLIAFYINYEYNVHCSRGKFMKTIYFLEEKDYIDFNLFQLEHSETIKKRLRIQRIMLFLLFALVALLAFLFLNRFRLLAAGLFLLMGILWYWNFPNFARKRMTKSTKKAIASGRASNLFDEVVLEIRPDEIIERKSGSEYKTNWEKLDSFSENEESIYLIFNDQQSLIIPKRALKEADLKKLKEMMHHHFEEKTS